MQANEFATSTTLIESDRITRKRRGDRAILASAALTVTTTLAGCGGAPSESEMKAVFDRQTANERQGLERNFGKQVAKVASDSVPTVDGVHKIGCKDDGEKAYRCDVEVEIKMMGATNKKVANVRFVKGSNGWQVTE